MTFLGFNLETSVYVAGLTGVVLAILLAAVTAVAFRWNGQLQAQKDDALLRFQDESKTAAAGANQRAA